MIFFLDMIPQIVILHNKNHSKYSIREQMDSAHMPPTIYADMAKQPLLSKAFLLLFVIFRGAGTAHRNGIAKGFAALLRSLSSAFRVRCCRCCVGGCGSRLEIADFTVFSTRFSFYGLTGQNGLPAIW